MTTASTAADLNGVWGGPGAVLTIDAHNATFQQDCATARFGLGKMSKSGAFVARGTWEDHQPGPQRADVPPAGRTATFSGRVSNDQLVLTVRKAGESSQTFNLTKGKRFKIIRCL